MSRMPLDRTKWLDDIVKRITGKPGVAAVDAALTTSIASLGSRRLSAALVIAEVARRHTEGELLGSIITALVRNEVLREDEKTREAVLVAISMFRERSLTQELWWRPDLLHATLIELWAGEARKNADFATVSGVLEGCWSVDAKSARALAGEPEAVEPLGVFVARWCERSGVVRDFLQTEIVRERRSDIVAQLPEFARANADLVAFAEWREVWRQTLDLLRQAAPEEASAVTEHLHVFGTELQRLLRVHADRLSMLELGLLSSRNADDRLLEDYVALIPRRFTMTSYGGFVMANGLPDRVGDVTLVPDWLADNVYSAGGRSGYDSSGPTAYLWLALEPHEEFAETGPPALVVGEATETEYPFELVLVLGPAEDAPHISFGMGHGAETREFLALMLLTRRLIVDVFRVDGDAGLVLLHRYAREATALIDAISDRVLAVLRAAAPARQFSFGGLDDHVLVGFAASENAKSELLLSLDEEPAGESADRLVRQRTAYLDVEVSRVRLLHVHADTAAAEDDVLRARLELANAWGEYRARRQQGRGTEFDPVAELHADIAGLATAQRALVHFNLKLGHLQGFWVADAGEQRGWLPCENVDLRSIARALQPWLHGVRGDADALVEAASPLAVELEQALSASGVEETVIMPWAVLQGVPFGALRVADGRLDDVMRISYSPSVSILRIGDRVGQRRDVPGIVAAHGGTLRWADAEVRALRRIYGCEPLVEASRDHVIATMEAGRVVHVASHGQWWREDHFASVLDLRIGGPIDRFISAADIHRDVSLRGAEIVVLSACDTGRAPTDRRGIEGYTGIDAAFLVRGAKAVVSTMWRVDDFAAMLFSVNFHALLSRGTSVAEAFTSSVHAVRNGGAELDAWAVLALDHAAGGWREKRTAHARVLRETATWATFKLSGPHWLARPLPPP
jgi:CHAT domain